MANKKQSLSNVEIQRAANVIDIVGLDNRPGDFAMTLAQIRAALEPTLKSLTKIHETLVTKYALKDGDNFVPATDQKTGKENPGSKQVDPKQFEAFNAEYNAVLDQVTEVDTPMMKMSDIVSKDEKRGMVFPPAALRFMLPFIDVSQ